MMKLTDDVKIITYRRDIESYFDIYPTYGAFFKYEFLKRKNWKALIFEVDFDDTDGILSAASSAFNLQQALAMDISYQERRSIYRLSLSHEDLAQVHNEFFIPSYVIVEESNEKFIVVSDSDYYWGIASDDSFLRYIAKSDVFAILSEFRAGIQPYVVSHDPHNRRVGKMLDSYYELCRQSWLASP